LGDRELKNKYSIYGYLFILPFYLSLAVFVIYPQLYSLYISFTSWDGGTYAKTFVELENYKRLFFDSQGLFVDPLNNSFLVSAWNTLLLWIMNFTPQITVALALAVLLTARKVPGTNFFRAVFYFPNLVTMTSVAVIFYFMVDQNSGLLNKILVNMGWMDPENKFSWLTNAWATRGSIAFTLFWMWFGYTMIVFIAGIKGIPVSYYEAAYVDGANKWHAFKRITLPLLKPIILYNLVTSVIGGMTNFDIPFIITRGTGAPDGAVKTSVMYIHETGFRFSNFGYAATITVALFVLIAIFVWLSFRLMYSKEEISSNAE